MYTVYNKTNEELYWTLNYNDRINYLVLKVVRVSLGYGVLVICFFDFNIESEILFRVLTLKPNFQYLWKFRKLCISLTRSRHLNAVMKVKIVKDPSLWDIGENYQEKSKAIFNFGSLKK